MDTPVVLSHKSAYLVLHARDRQAVAHSALTSPIDPYGISQSGTHARNIAARIRTCLKNCGVPLKDDARIDIVVPAPQDRTSSTHFKCHVLAIMRSSEELIHIAPGLFAVGGALSFIQAATWMEPLELIEYGYELCGRYELDPSEPKAGYRDRRPFTNTRRIRAALDAHPHMPGAKRARRALAFVRDGSRSPMETALALAIVLPKSKGGLGYRHIELNHRIAIPKELKPMTSSNHLEIDIFAPKKNAGIEYDGDEHSKLKRRSHDADRSAILGMLGISLRTITGLHFAQQLEFHRAMNSIAVLLHIDLPTAREFQSAQNDLRITLIRGWSHDNASPPDASQSTSRASEIC